MQLNLARPNIVWNQVAVSALLAMMVAGSPLAATSSGTRNIQESFAFIHVSVISMVQEGVSPPSLD